VGIDTGCCHADRHAEIHQWPSRRSRHPPDRRRCAGIATARGLRGAGGHVNTENVSGVWIIIPAYNECKVICQIVQQVRTFFKNVVVINDGSSDETAQRAAEGGAIVLSHPINLGQGAALQTGITFALRNDAKFIVTFDADGQHQIEDVPGMLAVMRRDGLDVVLGSRFMGSAINIAFSRRMLLYGAVLFTRLTTGLSLTDAHNGLRVLSRKAAAAIDLHQNRMAHASEILEQIARNQMKYAEVGNTVRYTDYSMAKGQRASNAINIIVDIVVGRLDK